VLFFVFQLLSVLGQEKLWIKKTPLLRSEEALSAQAVKMLKLIGDTDVNKVTVTLGVEQEFFLIDRAFYLARPDLVVCGRTVLGAKPPKGQEMEDHYFGSIPERILACIEEVEWQAWKLGVPMKTRHNEVAPSQFEMSPIFEEASLASDHNMLLMELLKSTAERHGLICLLHEKPFNGINGSGKHNNWSMQTDTGINLLDPGKTPEQNARFIVFLTAVIKAVDQYAHLLRCSIVTPGNDHRLGGNEAPPAIISIYLGDQLNDICQKLMGETPSSNSNKSTTLRLRAATLPPLPRDQSDRNRTSPFAFTGNKFEFRAVGSSQSPARPMFILNSIVADSLRTMIEELEALLKSGKDQNSAVETLVQTTLKKHYRIVFNGNGYSKEWEKEAQARGLRILRSSPEAVAAWDEPQNINMFESLGVLNAVEARSHGTVWAEQFVKATTIETQVALSMARTQVLPSAIKYQECISSSLNSLRKALGVNADNALLKEQRTVLTNLTNKINQLVNQVDKLNAVYSEGEKMEDHNQQMFFFQKEVAKELANLREVCDYLETVVDDSLWPLPKYSEMLFLK
jgi:glutamine synthetase